MSTKQTYFSLTLNTPAKPWRSDRMPVPATATTRSRPTPGTGSEQTWGGCGKDDRPQVRLIMGKERGGGLRWVRSDDDLIRPLCLGLVEAAVGV